MTRSERQALIDRADSHLSIARQSQLLKVARSTLYYRPAPVSHDDLAVMRRLDEQYLVTPFYGARRMAAVLRREGLVVNRKRIRRLMRVMGIEAIYQKPNTSRRRPEHKVYPYLLRGMAIERPNQVWCADITYIPMAKGFVYLVAVMDWFSRRVLAWQLSIDMDTDFCVEALQEAIERFGQPEVFNTGQGVQFTSAAFLHELEGRGVRVSMDSKGRFLDNIFIERLWRSLKYEEVFIKAYGSVAEARRGIGAWKTCGDVDNVRGVAHIPHSGATEASHINLIEENKQNDSITELKVLCRAEHYPVRDRGRPIGGESLLANPDSCPADGDHLRACGITAGELSLKWAVSDLGYRQMRGAQNAYD